MTAAGPPEYDSKTKRLIELGGRVRKLTEAERTLLLGRLRVRVDRRRSRPNHLWLAPLAAASLLAGALMMYGWKGRTPLAQRAEPAQPSATAARSSRSDVATNPAAPPGTPLPAQRRIVLAGRGELVLEPDAVVHGSATATGPVSFALRNGRLTADVATRAADEPLSIVTPQVVVTVVGTKFSVAVANELTTVEVEHGKVRVERSGHTLLVGAGESVRSDDVRFAAPDRAARVLPSAAAAVVRAAAPARGAGCDQAARSPDRGVCLERRARGQGLRAENALVSLALFERDERGDYAAALARLYEYERRFPNGALMPEVALAIATTLLKSERRGEACAYAETFAARFPNERATVQRLSAPCAAVEPARAASGPMNSTNATQLVEGRGTGF